ncbi:MAG: hypothetical protein JNL21_13290 [Myxococcales bacterium]|nr:hypothetical protein [Myxococcales bacterium]
MRRLLPRTVFFLCFASTTLARAVLAKETEQAEPRTQAGPESALSRPRVARAPADEPVGSTPPSPLEVEYAQYGVALATEVPLFTGGVCPEEATTPCIIGLGGGPILRGGYRPAGPWYFGGAYQFSKLDSNNLYRLGILQQLRGELRYLFATGSRVSPYVSAGLGGMVYGNEFSVQTGGATALAGLGLEMELTRFAVVGLDLAYNPMLFAGFVDTAGQSRDTGVAHYLHLELVIELRTELNRE